MNYEYLRRSFQKYTLYMERRNQNPYQHLRIHKWSHRARCHMQQSCRQETQSIVDYWLNGV